MGEWQKAKRDEKMEDRKADVSDESHVNGLRPGNCTTEPRKGKRKGRNKGERKKVEGSESRRKSRRATLSKKVVQGSRKKVPTKRT